MSLSVLRRVFAPAVFMFGLAGVVGAVVAVSAGPAAAQEGSTNLLYRVVAPTGVAAGDTDILVEITAENASNLGAFAFQLTYDPDILDIALDEEGNPLIVRGDFLGSSGREVVCQDPVSQAGVLRMSCITLRMEPQGVDGSGTLATVTFVAKATGTTELALDRLEANEPDATEIRPIDVQGATLEVQDDGGLNWLLWGPIIAIGALAVIGIVAFIVIRARPGDKSTAPAT
jgi:hypothetical protein